MRARIFVTLKDGVLDPAGKATEGGLKALGYGEVQGVRLGKLIEVELDDRPDADQRLKEMCEKLLANTVIEKYRIEMEG